MTVDLSTYEIGLPSGEPLGLGPIIQAKFAKTDGTRVTINTRGALEIPNMSIEFTPKSENSIIELGGVLSSGGTYVHSFYAWLEDTEAELDESFGYVGREGNLNNTRQDAIQTVFWGTTSTIYITPYHMHAWHRNYGTSTRTYSLRISTEWTASPRTMYIDNNSSNDYATMSHMYVWEYDMLEQTRAFKDGALE